MKYRYNTIISLVTIFTVLTLTSCDILDTGEGEVNELSLHFNTTEPVVESADGNNSIEVTRMKMSVRRIGFMTLNFQQDTVTVDTMSFDEQFPKVVSFNPGEVGTRVGIGEIDPQTFDRVFVEFAPPSGEVSDSDLGSNNSILIEGTYNNSSFSYRANFDTTASFFIDPSLEMTEQTATLDLDVLIKTASLFKGSSGSLLNPSDQSAKAKITGRFFNSLLFEEGNRTLRDYEDLRGSE